MKNKIYLALLFCITIISSNKSNAQTGNYIYFDGNDDYVDMIVNSNLYTLKKGTLSFWFKMNNLDNYQCFFSVSDKNNSGFNSDYVGVSFRNIASGGSISPGRRIEYAEADNGAGQSVSLSDPDVPNDNNWHHLAIVADDIGNLEIYLDGSLINMSASYCCGPIDRFLGYATTANNMKLGVIERVSYDYYGDFYMDDFCLYDTLLTGSQVSGLYEKTFLTYNNHLQINYTFETYEDLAVGIAGVNDVRDQTGNNNHGDAFDATIIQATGVLNPTLNTGKIRVYPNPVNSDHTVFIEALNYTSNKAAKVTLTDQVGKVISTYNLDLSGNGQMIHLPSSLLKGNYLISVISEDITETRKLVLE